MDICNITYDEFKKYPLVVEGESKVDGYISKEKIGNNGFGYDSIFVGNDTFDMSYAELDSLRKNLRSHRRYVLKDFRDWLNSRIKY